eukprot:CAMPEP_0176377698 /NCGR_PEP_ID=MMETSP0126-20121128/29083_1 /TAXON_ID=141414 ORGANISM="Strombidinopsis acuminatum, Strain SPMC142" /NCGR_SAMPLE_ID=MMETSP0126 /ASSEMBLY_ACC=CAM_ASM_000229 /LENGTH=141 /DNA_ID=CAMNT_0017739665 /DNA_START=26 /DNA_END=451 /DNA_ORIENTATION=+
MGCGCVKTRNEAKLQEVAHNESDVASISTFGKGRYVCFEASLPFSRTLIWGYIKNLKEAADRNPGENKDYVTIENLRQEFVTEAWVDLGKEDSVIRKILNDPFLKYEWEDDDEEKVEGALDVLKLQLVGLLWCQGEDKEKA